MHITTIRETKRKSLTISKCLPSSPLFYTAIQDLTLWWQVQILVKFLGKKDSLRAMFYDIKDK